MRRSGQEDQMEPYAGPGMTGHDPSGSVARIQQAGEDAIDAFFRN